MAGAVSLSCALRPSPRPERATAESRDGQVPAFARARLPFREVSSGSLRSVDKSALVQASTCYGHDNSYVADAVAAHPDRFTGVFSVDKLPVRYDHVGLRIDGGGGEDTARFDADGNATLDLMF